MAKPQLEDGHTRIANEILEHLMTMHLAPNQWQVLLCIIRKTYGYHKKVDYIANSQIVEATGLCKAVVSRALSTLEEMQVINRHGKYIGFQKDWERWGKLAIPSTTGSELAKQLTKQKLAVSPKKLAEMSLKVSSCAVAQKKKETKQKKDIIIKKEYGEFNNVLLSDEEYRKLEVRFGGTLKDRIEKLSCGIEGKGYKYISHYATILSWSRSERDFHPVPKPSRPVPSHQEPDKYIKGKYGHMTRRT